MAFQLMKYTRIEPGHYPAEAMGIDALVDELRPLRRDLAEVRLDRDRAHANAEHQLGEWAEGQAYMRRTWGPDYQTQQPPARIGEAREQVAIIDEHIAAMVARRADLAAALDRRIGEAEATIAAEAEAQGAREREVVEREARLRELTAPLLAFEGYPANDGILPLIGTTDHLRGSIFQGQRDLAAWRSNVARARVLAGEVAADRARETATVAIAAD